MLTFRLCVAAGLLAAAGSGWAAADKNMIHGHLHFLAGDAVEGRETGSRGYDVAAQYVATRFQQYGLAPKGDGGGFLQAVPLRATRLVPDSAVVELIGPSGKETLAQLDDYIVGGSLLEDYSEVTAPLVFAGYGIHAERFGQDDYANLDVAGKIVVVLAGKPSRLPTEEGAHFGSSLQKRDLAARHGAVGMIVVQTPESEKAMPFARMRHARALAMGWLDAGGTAAHQPAGLQNQVQMSMRAAEKLFSQSDVKLADILALAASNRPLPRMSLDLSAHLAKRSSRSELSSSNIVGLIKGSDPVLSKEFVVLSAHLDHLGMAQEKLGDKVFNGAMDNASGVATLIEAARLVSQSAVGPKRSILFVALTGEEKGLLGSDFFASNPALPRGAIVANVNLDMPLLTYDFKNVIAFGAEHSTLKGTVERALKAMGLSLIPDPAPEMGVFTRSDHYSFVRQGVPSIFLATGTGSFKRGENPGKLWAAFMRDRYHQPGDDLGQPINFDAAARFADLNYRIVMEIAGAPEKPAWNRGDFFGDTFRK